MYVHRLPERLPVSAVRTYALLPGRVTETVSCEQAGCEAWRGGFRLITDPSTELGLRQAAYVRGDRTRGHREARRPDGMIEFDFPAGTRCFREHRVRETRYAVRDGDHRGNPTGWRREHVRAADWVEDFGAHQQRLADRQAEG